MGPEPSWLLLAVFAVAQLFVLAPRLFTGGEDTAQIALVGPMSGPDAALGAAMMAGAELLVERANATRAPDSKRIEIIVRDDANDPVKAREIAFDLAEKSAVVAVLGHLTDKTSAAAGPIYKEKGLAVVTGASGTPAVTAGNSWYFRVGLTTAHQGVFLTHYMARVLAKQQLIVIHSEDDYGRSLWTAVDYEQSFIKRLGISQLAVKRKLSFDPAAPDSDKAMDAIVAELSKSYGGEMLLLAVGEDTAATLIGKLQDNPRRRFGKPMPYKIIGPDSLGRPSLIDSFSKGRRENNRPGITMEGVHAVAPFLEDVANQQALEFRRDYEQRNGRPAGIVAAGFHDAAAMVVAALDGSDADGTDLAAMRKAARDRLASFDKPAKSVAGVTGGLYFDRDGNAVKTAPIGVYRDRRLVSPPLQLSAVGSVDNLKPNETYQISGHYFTPTRIVHTGLRVNEITDIDLDNRRARLDFNLWFRHLGELDLGAIEFPNAAEPITLGEPIEQMAKDGAFYRLYRVKGVFQSDFADTAATFGKRLLGVQVRHRTLNRTRLILVPDILGMASGESGSLTERITRKTVFGESTDWAIRRADMYLDTEAIAAMGNPDMVGKHVEGYSRFNLGVWIEPTDLTLRGLVAFDTALNLFLLCGFAAGFLGIMAAGKGMQGRERWFWFPQALIVIVMLFCGEALVIEWLTPRVSNPFHVEVAATGFKILWWMAPAWLFNRAIEHFFWKPLEQRTGREIPPVVRVFTAGLVYTLAMMGVIAFVFDQKVTSLLATSGVLAMIFGLALQMNLSNVFSGIAINMERPFRMGDWIRVADYEPGKVVSITWRTTRIETLDQNIICILNSVASDSTVENLSYPREAYRSEQMVHVDPGAKPEWVEKILYDAVISATGIMRDPAPSVVFQGVKDWSACYAVRFFCEDYERSIPVAGEVWRDIVRILRFAGFESVIHQEFTLFHLRDKGAERPDTAALLIDDVDVFQPFDSNKKASLCESMNRIQLEPERTVVTQGDAGESLFIVAEGALMVQMTMEDSTVLEVGRLGPGDFFGEMALLTGEPRGATITTLTTSQIFEIEKRDIEPIIQEFPEIAEDLSRILTRRMLENLRQRNDHYASLDEEKSLARNILNKIGRFFQLTMDDRKPKAAVSN